MPDPSGPVKYYVVVQRASGDWRPRYFCNDDLDKARRLAAELCEAQNVAIIRCTPGSATEVVDIRGPFSALDTALNFQKFTVPHKTGEG
jgi:hypothetical protein